MYKSLIRPILFKFQPETIHHFVFSCLRFATWFPFLSFFVRKMFLYENPKLKRTVFGIDFPNPVGLAAGLDKDAEIPDMLGYLGFGFVEIGTLTPKAQPGNPKPRLFRLRKNSALINRMGFNNNGVDEAIKNLRKRKSKVIVGGNIGKNKITPNENATDDYIKCFNALYEYVDYFVVNVSSPNTPNLRALQEKEPLQKLLSELKNLALQKPKYKPVLLKIAPDLTFEQIDDVIDIVQKTKIDGIVATNTTISREGIDYSTQEIEQFGAGGLSGKPLKKRSTEVIRYISEKTQKNIPIIGVGGVMTAEDVKEKLEAGASLVQVYTGFIYEGPGMAKNILKKL